MERGVLSLHEGAVMHSPRHWRSRRSLPARTDVEAGGLPLRRRTDTAIVENDIREFRRG